MGYIEGAEDTTSYYNAVDEVLQRGGPMYCIPRTATLGQLRLVLLKYLRDNPETLHYSAAGAIKSAFTKAFPCPKQ